MLYLMEEVHRLAFNNAPTGLSELDCVFTTFWGMYSFSNLVLISPQLSWTLRSLRNTQ